MEADAAEKQGHSIFSSRLPFGRLASTKGRYVRAIYARALPPSPLAAPPPYPRRVTAGKPKWSCSRGFIVRRRFLFFFFLRPSVICRVL